MDEAPESDLDLLRRLVAEIAAGDYRDKFGHRLTNNTAYLEAAAVLEIYDTLDAERPPHGGGSSN